MKKKTRFTLAACLTMLFMAVMIVAFPQETKAAGNYYIRVNKATNVVTVYTANNNTAVKAFTCSTGSATQPGTYSTSNKYRWHVLDGPSYGQYCTRIYGSVLFHSVWYYEQDVTTQSTVQFNKLGTMASHGCVRLTTADAKWIYDNCVSGTTVTIFNGTSADDPLGKPSVIKVPETSRSGWDPTDPDTSNPYHYTQAAISGPTSTVEVAYGSTWNPLAGISALNSCGVSAPDLVTYSGKVNTNKLGNYTVTYTIKDQLGKSASTTVKYKVVDTQGAWIYGVKAKKTREYNYVYNIKQGVTAKTVSGKNLTNKIVVKVKAPGAKKEKVYKKSKLKLSKVGTYTISYAVRNPYNKIKTTKSIQIVVKDRKAPIVSGTFGSVAKEYNASVNLKSGITAKLLSGKNIKSKMNVYVRTPGAKSYKKLSAESSSKYKLTTVGTYRVKYISTNPVSKKKTTKYKNFVVKDTKAPTITLEAVTPTVEYNAPVNLLTGASAAKVSGTDVTENMTIYVETAAGSNQYTALTKEQAESYSFTGTGSYRVRYVATNPVAKTNGTYASATKTRTYRVIDIAKPVVTLDETLETLYRTGAEVGTEIDLRTGLKAALVSGTDVSSSAQIQISGDALTESVTLDQQTAAYTFAQAGEYTVTYTVINPQNTNAVTKITRTLTVGEGSELEPTGAAEQSEVIVSPDETLTPDQKN